MNNKEYFKDFNQPDAQYRGIPFWAWNGKLEISELRRQIRVMKQMGLGGFFMHSRVGLATEYLGKEWFDCVNACADEAEKNGLKAWLYDEDRWPSGAAGGMVTSDHQYRRKLLMLEECDSFDVLAITPASTALFAATVKNGVYAKARRLPLEFSPKELNANEKLLHFYIKTMDDEDWFNGQAYLDVLSIEAVRKFIDVTHEKYLKEVGDKFGSIIPGIFSDEPYFAYAFEENNGKCSIAWSDKLPEVFLERCGYDIVDHLPELFFDLETAMPFRARYHYFDCVTAMFVKAFAEQIGTWCEDHGLNFTGHVMNEDSLSAQSSCIGSCMRFYEHMQIPGIDQLTEIFRNYDTAKQVSSAARQFGRKWRLTETYGCTGWDFSLGGHRALGDWQVALGVNMRAQHLSWYSMQGEAKRDYPASILHQSPWWEVYSGVEDYFARLNMIMSEGREIRDLLVIHPNESMWLKMKKNWRNDPEVAKYDNRLMRLRDQLLSMHLDFDYGDEEILSRHTKNSCQNDPAVLKIGDAEYKAVLVPELLTIRKSTLKILQDFRKNGGMVVFAGEPPELVDGKESDVATEFAGQCVLLPNPVYASKLNSVLNEKVRRVSITGDNGKEIPTILYQLRECEDYYSLFICNTGHDRKQLKGDLRDSLKVAERRASFDCVNIRLFNECKDTPLELDADNGSIWRINQTEFTGKMMQTSLEPLQSRLFVFPKKRGLSMLYPVRSVYLPSRNTTFINQKCPVELSEDNVFVLDRPEYRIGDGEWHPADEILRIDQEVRSVMGLAFRAARGKQPWVRKKEDCDTVPVKVELRHKFNVKDLPGKIFLATETPERFSVELNGQQIDINADRGWWHDISMRKISLSPAILCSGENTLTLHCEYTYDFSGLETVFLLGDFGVELVGGVPEVTAPVTKLEPGDWTKQGLPFYAGSVRYKYYLGSISRADCRMSAATPEFSGAAVRVLVNGQAAGVIYHKYQEVDITDYLDNDKNELTVEVFGHCRNSHGPLHWANRNPHFVTPWDFITRDNEWTDDYILAPCGLICPPVLHIKEINQTELTQKTNSTKKEKDVWNTERKQEELAFSR